MRDIRNTHGQVVEVVLVWVVLSPSWLDARIVRASFLFSVGVPGMYALVGRGKDVVVSLLEW